MLRSVKTTVVLNSKIQTEEYQMLRQFPFFETFRAFKLPEVRPSFT
jgi:hypothetical protein